MLAVAETLRRATDRAAARLRLKRASEMTAQVEPRNRQSDDDTENKRADETNCRQPAIELNPRAERQAVRPENFE